MAQPPALNRSSVSRAIYNQGKLIYSDSDKSIRSINEMFYKMSLENDNVFFINRDSMFKVSNDGKGLLKDTR